MMETENIFINRELSWLDFDKRVLALAKDKHVPLAEQFKFAAIFASNLDEFFMVRVGTLYDQTLLREENVDQMTHLTASQQIAAIIPRVSELQTQCDKYIVRLTGALEEKGYQHINFEKLDKEQERFWKKYFENELLPVLSPQVVDQRHPFPFLRNKEIYFCVQLKNKADGAVSYGLIPVSSPQFERVLTTKVNGVVCYGLLEELVYHFGTQVFEKSAGQKKCLLRVSRNADITADEGMMDHDVDFREVMSELLKKRRKLAAVRLQMWPAIERDTAHFFCEKLMLPERQCFAQQSPLDLSWCFRLANRLAKDGRKELFYPAATPMAAPNGFDLRDWARQGDVLLAYPYQSIRPFIKMLMQAANDPDVISIKMTLYRMAHDSQIVQALMAAAENGKEVVAVVELRARFDEQNNIDWSKQLERAGCNVIYGFDDYKVHSKLTLITSKKGNEYRYLTQIGTGNYNEKTSEQYTDLSFITTRPEIGEEAAAVFTNMAVQRLTTNVNTMLVAPLCFKSVLLSEMEREIEKAKAGRPASMILKNNSVNDRQIIEKLCEASCAGVRVDMIVRGICCMKAGIQGKTENVHIRSIVGRYLEHSRIYCFGEGADMRVYLASGDFLTRNTERRVEVGVRVDDVTLKEKLRALLQLQLDDNVNAREMQPDGSYSRVKAEAGEASIDSQMEMYAFFRDEWNIAAAAEVTPKPQNSFWNHLLGFWKKKS